MRLRIEYADQNESFAAQLPRFGTVVAQPKSCDSSHTWYLVHLDAPVVYKGAPYTHILIASRWQGYSIGDAEPTSVFILLVPRSMQVGDGFSYHQYLHVAWGMAHAA